MMYIPVRNQWTATIMYWLDAASTRRVLQSGALSRYRQRQSRLRAELAACEADRQSIRSLAAQAESVRGLPRAIEYVIANDCDLIGAVRMPTALAASEDLYAEAHRIADRHVDHGDARYYSTPEEHAEFLRSQLAVGPIGDESIEHLLAIWVLRSTMSIDDEPSYVLEDGRRFASAKEAEQHDTLPSTIPAECRYGRRRAVEWLTK